MRKVLAYIPLHYGKEYLKESILAIQNHVEKIIVLYTPIPSQGFGTTVTCPDTKEELQAIVKQFSRTEWVEGQWGHESQHRAHIYQYATNYDQILAVDADEVWDEQSLVKCLDEASKIDARYIGIRGFVNFWKSFNHACYDGFAPIRIINVKVDNSKQEFIDGKVFHFSCAQSYKTVKYKLEVTGHKDEIRKDWLTEIYLKWTPQNNIQDIHLVSIGLWNAVPFDKTTLPRILQEHPNFHKDAIY
jgi:hypothetical protein